MASDAGSLESSSLITLRIQRMNADRVDVQISKEVAKFLLSWFLLYIMSVLVGFCGDATRLDMRKDCIGYLHDGIRTNRLT